MALGVPILTHFRVCHAPWVFSATLQTEILPTVMSDFLKQIIKLHAIQMDLDLWDYLGREN